jgi:hypothetical protein
MRYMCLPNHFNINRHNTNHQLKKFVKLKTAFHCQVFLSLRVTEGSDFQENVYTSEFKSVLAPIVHSLLPRLISWPL